MVSVVAIDANNTVSVMMLALILRSLFKWRFPIFEFQKNLTQKKGSLMLCAH